jgi:serine/threonine-protein kinase
MSDGISRLAPGGHLGRYELLEELGRGGMGIVFKARDPAIGRFVAIKTLRLDLLAGSADIAEASARFAREARAVGQLSHPHIVTLYDAQQEGELAYLVMEFVTGKSLESLLLMGRTFPLDRVCAIGIEVCDALEHAHSRNVVHRDVKPANILLQENGQAKVTDFGVAYLAKSTLTKPGQSPGTPSYMSPEQIEGKPVDGRSDLFSLGAVLYELCCGQKAFPGETISTVIYRILHTEPVPLQQLNPHCPPALDVTIRRALAKDPVSRYATAREFWGSLAQTTAGMASPATRAIPPKSPRRTAPAPAPASLPRRYGLLIGVAATVVGILLAGLLWLSRPSGPRSPVPPEHADGSTASAPPAPTAPPPGHSAASPAVPAPPVQSGGPKATSGPRAVRVTFAREVKGVLPVEEGDTFYRDDRKVILWVRWANVRGRHTKVTRWFNPEEELVYTSPSPESFESPADWWTTWTTLPLRREMAVKAGRWRAEIQLDNQPMVTAHFLLLDRPRPAAASLPSARKP